MEKEKKIELLSEFKIKYENIDDIEILEEGPSYIYTRNKKTNELLYATIKYFRNRQYFCNEYISLYHATKLNDVIHEKYYHVFSPSLKLEEIKKSLKQTELTDNDLIFQRAYTDVESKYGEMCLVIENSGNSKYYRFDSKSSIGLFHGSSEKIIDPNSTLEPTFYHIFRNFSQNQDFYNYMLGHEFGSTKEHMWSYRLNNKYIYSIENVGAIIEDGSINVLAKEYKEPEYCPLSVYVLAEEYNNILSKKAETKGYFRAGFGTILVIEKEKENISVKLYTKFNKDRKPQILLEKKLPKFEKGSFSPKEITLILAILDAEKGKDYFKYLKRKTYKANKKYFKDISSFSQIKKALIDYKNFKENVNSIQIDLSSPYCLPIKDFDKAVHFLRQSDNNLLVNNIIQNYMTEFNISLKNLLGNNTMTKEQMESNIQYKKNIKYNEPFKKY